MTTRNSFETFTARKSFEIYTIVNSGTHAAFPPNKKVIDQYTNTERTLLAIHVDKVLEVNDPAVCFIVDSDGYRMEFEGPL